MRRRRMLAVVGSTIPFAGCTIGESGPSNSTSGDTTRIATETPTETCSEVETEFKKPSLTKSQSLSAETAKQAGYEIERAYQETIDVSPADFSEVRGHRENSFDYRLLNVASTEIQSGYQVEVIGLVSWTEVREGGNETTEVIYSDRPLRVAMYDVTTRWIHRRSGIGDLEGTILCW